MPNLESLPRLDDQELTVAADLDCEHRQRRELLELNLRRLRALTAVLAVDPENFSSLHDEDQAALWSELCELATAALEAAKAI